MSIKENLIKETYDLDVIEMKNGIVDVSVPFDVVKSFLNSFFMKEGYLVVKGDNIDSRSYFKVLDDEIKLVIRVRDNIFIYEKLNLETLETEIELKELDGVMHIRNIEKLFKFRKDTIEYADAVLSHLCYANYLAHTQKQVVIESTTKQVITKKKKAKRKRRKRRSRLQRSRRN